jgi:hypothetical protein
MRSNGAAAAEAHYENAIKGLEQIANTDQGAPRPEDRRHPAEEPRRDRPGNQREPRGDAIAADQPAGAASLAENFKTKIALLQDTVALINEMRKGTRRGSANCLRAQDKR